MFHCLLLREAGVKDLMNTFRLSFFHIITNCIGKIILFFRFKDGENSDNLSSLRYLWICLTCLFGSTIKLSQNKATRDKDNLPMPQDAEHGDQSVKTQEKNCGMTVVWFPSLGMVYLYVMPGFWARWNMSWKKGEGKYYHIFFGTTYMMC